MERLENSVAVTNGEREWSINRLTRVKGIAHKTAEAFYEMGIHDYAELASYSSQRSAQQVSADIISELTWIVRLDSLIPKPGRSKPAN